MCGSKMPAYAQHQQHLLTMAEHSARNRWNLPQWKSPRTHEAPFELGRGFIGVKVWL